MTYKQVFVKQTVLRVLRGAAIWGGRKAETKQMFDKQTGVLNIAHCRHVLAFKQPLPSGGFGVRTKFLH